MKQFEKLDEAIARYKSLMADPHPGLFTWCSMLGDALRDIKSEVFELLTAKPE